MASSSNFSTVWLIYVAPHARITVYLDQPFENSAKIYFEYTEKNIRAPFTFVSRNGPLTDVYHFHAETLF